MAKNVKKGQKAPREECVCEKCGQTFSRCVYHPYIRTCLDCRGKTKVSKVTCRFCRDYLKNSNHTPNRLFTCGKCKSHWWLFGDGYYRSHGVEQVLYHRGQDLGQLIDYGDLRRLLNEHKTTLSKVS